LQALVSYRLNDLRPASQSQIRLADVDASKQIRACAFRFDHAGVNAIPEPMRGGVAGYRSSLNAPSTQSCLISDGAEAARKGIIMPR
jgi:hypothetical protein